MSQAFGTGSPEWSDAVASNAAPPGTAARAKALTDYVGIAIHCGQGGGICAGNVANVANSRPDRLPDEPGGYLGYKALYGAKYVNPALCATPGASCQTVMGRPAVNSTAGDPVTDPFGQPGFPGFDGALAKNTLGYLAQMQEAGIPITWGYISTPMTTIKTRSRLRSTLRSHERRARVRLTTTRSSRPTTTPSRRTSSD